MSGEIDAKLLKLRNRVRQLLDLAAGGKCSEGEALNAASIAARLMNEYGITEADIEGSRMTTLVLPLPGSNLPKNFITICNTLGHWCGASHFCDRKEITYFGYEPDLVITEYLHTVCFRALMRDLAAFRKTSAYRRRRTAKTRVATSQAFVEGFAVAIYIKLAELMGGSSAEKRRDRSKIEMRQRFNLKTVSVRKNKAANLGRVTDDGHRAGKSVDLHRAVSGGEPVARIGRS